MLMSIQHVRKSFGNLEVLKDVHMNIDKGDVVVILGLVDLVRRRFCVALIF